MGRRYATWEFNPNMPRDCDFLKARYLEDFAVAERDYGANPPFASDPFIKRAAQLVPLFTKRSNVLAIDKIKVIKDSLGGRNLYPTIKVKPHNYPCVVSVDAGWKKNSFAIALSHRMPNPDSSDDKDYIATSGLLEIAPHEGIPISYNMVYEHVIRPIMENFNVVMFATDQWQGIDLQSRVYTDYEVDSLQLSVSYDNFEDLRTRIHSETWLLPKLDSELKDLLEMEKDFLELTNNKPVSHLTMQLLLSKDTGKSVIKNTDAGEDFTDDLLRASVLGVAIIESEEYGHLFTEEGEFEKQYHAGPVGFAVNLSGGSGRAGHSVPGIGVSISKG